MFGLAVVVIVCAIALPFADTKMRTQLNTIAASQAKNISTLVINAAVMEVLTESDVKYDDLVRIEYDDTKRVSAIKADSIKMNQLQSLISSKISERIAEINAREIKMAVGSLTGIDLFNNKGPQISIRITLAGNATTTISNQFESAGINQTRHQIILSVNTAIFVVLPSGSTSAEVLSNVIIAETIIVGMVPEFYAGGTLPITQTPTE
ncbi:MAG: sporulation protein YunB [Oscillospiraceae bacterium]|nr:sporulation protein YunB [Oscillospiraceae bacterium]